MFQKLHNKKGDDYFSFLIDLENVGKKCDFMKIDYNDGRFFRSKFACINNFVSEGQEECPYEGDDYGWGDHEICYRTYKMDVEHKLVKIRDLLEDRGTHSCE